MDSQSTNAPLLLWRDYRCKNPKCRRVIGATNGLLLEVGGWTHEQAIRGKCKCGLVNTWRPVANEDTQSVDIKQACAILEGVPV